MKVEYQVVIMLLQQTIGYILDEPENATSRNIQNPGKKGLTQKISIWLKEEPSVFI